MKFILSNRHCEICYTSTGMKGMLTVEDDISIEFIKTEEEAAEYISDFLYRTNQDCDKCGDNKWSVYNVYIDNVRLPRLGEIIFENFLKQNTKNLDWSFTSFLHQYYLEEEKLTEFCNESMKIVRFSQSFIDSHCSFLNKIKGLFFLRNDIVEEFKSIMEIDYKQTHFGPSIKYKYSESVSTKNTHYYIYDEHVFELIVEINKYGDVYSLRMIVTEGFFKLFQFLNSRISNSVTFVNYDPTNFQSCYFITIYDKLQMKVFPIEDDRCYEIKITWDLHEY